MGRRGPKPKSPELESKQGFPGRRKQQTVKALAEQPAAPEHQHDDIQDELCDSRFVQPPEHLGKRERRVWAEIFSGPSARLWYKLSDYNVIARYCVMTVQWRQISKTPPQPTYEVRRHHGESQVAEILHKRNPAFDAMLALARELRTIEERVGMNPDSRLSMEKKGLLPGKETPKADEKSTADRPPTPSGPLGVLKSKTKIN